MSDGTTHAEGCYSWGPKHYECALREIDRLRRICNQHGQGGLRHEIKRLRQQRDELVSWVDGVIEIVEIYRPETPSQKEWQKRMVTEAYRMIQAVVDAKCKEE